MECKLVGVSAYIKDNISNEDLKVIENINVHSITDTALICNTNQEIINTFNKLIYDFVMDPDTKLCKYPLPEGIKFIDNVYLTYEVIPFLDANTLTRIKFNVFPIITRPFEVHLRINKYV